MGTFLTAPLGSGTISWPVLNTFLPAPRSCRPLFSPVSNITQQSLRRCSTLLEVSSSTARAHCRTLHRWISNTNGILAPPPQERTPENAFEASQRRPPAAAARSWRWRRFQPAAAACQSGARRNAALRGLDMRLRMGEAKD